MRERTIDIADPQHEPPEAAEALKALLLARLAEAERGEVVEMSAADVAESEFRSTPGADSSDLHLRRGS